MFIYECINDDYLDYSEPIAGVIGVNIPGLISEEFRYSATPYSIELRCLNSPTSKWFNLIYEITTNNDITPSLGIYMS